jgi:hypothetical protein
MLDCPPKPPKPPDAKAKLQRECQRRYKKRRRDGKAIAPVCYDARVLDALVKNHWLDEHDCGDRQLVGAAISRLLRASFEGCD